MAKRLIAYVASPITPRFIAPEPGTPEYEARLDGMEPDVMLFNGAAEEKLAPNYSDWLRANAGG